MKCMGSREGCDNDGRKEEWINIEELGCFCVYPICVALGD